MRCASDCVVLTYTASRSQSLFKSDTDLGPFHLSTHENVLLSAQRIKNMWLLFLSVAHMDGAVGSEGTAGIWSRHPDCICCCDIKSAAYRMQPCNPPSADNGATMAILETCLPIPHLMSWATHQFSSNHDNLYKYRPELAQSKFLAHHRFWVNSLDGDFMPSLLSSVLYAVELERPNIY